MMANYDAAQLLRLAKRQNNRRRSYLLVNPLQAKHMPVSPQKARQMMLALGERLAQKFPATRLLIGFAETATAIGAIAAKAISDDCVYLATTRERRQSGRWLDFREEHSHAAEQRLCADRLAEWIAATDCVILLDDEFSTGRTLLNMLRQLKEHFPPLAHKQIVAASVLNRLNETQMAALNEAGVTAEWLLRLPPTDYAIQAESIVTVAAPEPPVDTGGQIFRRRFPTALPDPRQGIPIGKYFAQCTALSDEVTQALADDLAAAKRLLVLGTEECMLPAILLGCAIERQFPGCEVFCHATTRSPIGLAKAAGYPIRNGYCLPSFYEAARRTYIYNLADYELALVLTDATAANEGAMAALKAALKANGCPRPIFLEAG